MKKEEVAREELIWKKKTEDFIYVLCFYDVMFGTNVKTWMIFILVGMVITFTFSCLFFRDRRLGSILNCEVQVRNERFSRKIWSLVLRIASVRVESNGECCC